MSSYAFWNNKGGVGKSYLCFIASCEYAHRNPDVDVYVIDLCPQANVSETLMGGYATSPALKNLAEQKERATVAGYLEARLSSPFRPLEDVRPYVSHPVATNDEIPKNLNLICGDNLLEILAEAIRQTSQLSVPVDAWKQVIGWVKDLAESLAGLSGDRSAVFMIDCNPSFAIYTQLGLAAAHNIVVPFTADDSSRRAIENVLALTYGVGDDHIAAYSRINFSRRASNEGVSVPLLHTFGSNRVTYYENKASKAFQAATNNIQGTLRKIHTQYPHVFSNPASDPISSFVTVPDYHSACIVSSMKGIPLHKLMAGPQNVADERVQINVGPLTRYRNALENFVNAL